MSAWDDKKIEEVANGIIEKTGPTIELEDLQVVIPAIMEITEAVGEMTKEEKHETALNLFRYVLDNTDTPWLPDTVTDPLFYKVADLVLIPVIAKASKGEFSINK